MLDHSSDDTAGTSIETNAPAWLSLHHEMKSETRAQCSWDARRARHLRDAEAHQVWIHFGYISILEYLEREHGIEPRPLVTTDARDARAFAGPLVLLRWSRSSRRGVARAAPSSET